MSKLRRTLTNSTALQAAVGLAFVVPAVAQPAPNARPQGGQVVAGAAAINNSAAATTINQTSNRAAIEWRSFDVGSNQSVIFKQPSASSVTLNRVTGPDPSAIAGQIRANGQLVLTNPSGVVFHAGAQVNAQSVIVSAPGILNGNFMAGRMVFDQPGNPNARITNAGTITVKEAGLAALVAPSVANSGTITARLGHVVLAGAATHTLDMYGDGLVSIDITKQVTQAPVGADGKTVTALVTNTGTIAADGGTVQLTARAADGVVNTLVQAGSRGTIRANTIGNRAGQIEITGTGGSVVIEGRVAADGRAPGTTGGTVVVAGSDTTAIAPTARVTATGRAGGGTVAVGTTLARARTTGTAPAGTSGRTVVAAGARISADATEKGDGGRVTVLSTQSTAMDGTLTARGGRVSGDGGMVEVSGQSGFRLTGTADTSAPHGALGTVLIDPRDLTITTSTPPVDNITPTPGTDPNIGYAQGGTTTDAYVTPEQIQGLTGNVRLQASRDLLVTNDVTYGNIEGGTGTGGNLTLEAGRNLTVSTGVTITVPGFQGTSSRVPGVVTLTAAATNIPGYDPAGTLSLLGNVNTSSLKLSAGTGGIVIGGALDTTYVSGRNVIDTTSISTTGAVTQNTGSTVTTGNLIGTAASLSLTATGNQIAAIGGLSPSLTGGVASGTSAPFTTTAGGVTIVTSVPLTVGSSSAGTAPTGITVPTGQTISLQTDSLALQSGAATSPALSAPGGTVSLQPLTAEQPVILTSGTTKPGYGLTLTTAETKLIAAPTLQLSGPSSDFTVGQTGDAPIDLIANGNFSQLQLAFAGSVTQNAALRVNALSDGATGAGNDVTLTNTGNVIPSIGTLTARGTLTLTTSGALAVTGAVSGNANLTLTSAAGMTVLTGASVSGPNGLNLVAGTAGTGSLAIAGAASSDRGTAFTAGSGGIALSGTITPGQTLQTASTGPLTQTTGAIVGGTLTGNAAGVSLTSRTNTLTGVSSFAASGDFLLVNNAPLQVFAPPTSSSVPNAGLTVTAGHTATLVTDSLTIAGNGSGGGFGISGASTLAVAPYTAGGAVLLTTGTKPSTGLSLTTNELSLIDAPTLQIGGPAGSATVPTAGAITIGQARDATIDLGSSDITRLVLNASGAVTQNVALAVTTLAGRAGSVALADVGNYISQLDGFTTTAGDLALHTSAGLTVSNAVSASGNLTLSTVATVTGRTDGTSLLLAANLSGGTVRFDTTDGSGGALGVLQTAGVVTADTLTGVASTLRLTQSNQIANLGDFTTTGELTISDGRALRVTGSVTSNGYALTLNAAGITQTPTSSINTTELDGSASADTVLDSRLNTVNSMGYFNQTAGSFTLVTSSPQLNFGANSGQVTATTGSLTFVADAVGLVSSPATGTSISAPAGLITFSPFGVGLPIALNNSYVVTPASSALTLSAAFRSYLHGDTLGLGTTGYTGAISIGPANETIDLSAFRALQVQTSGAIGEGTNVATDFGNPGDGRLIVSSLNGTAGSIVLPNTNTIATLGQSVAGGLSGLAATAGPLTLATGVGLTLSGPVSASTAMTLTTPGAVSIVNSLTARTITLNAGGSVSEASTAAQISAGTLTITAPSVTLNGTGNRITTLSSTVSGGLSLTDATGLAIAAGSTIGGTLNLTVTGALTGGNVTAQALTGSATSVSLPNANNQITSLGPFTSSGGFSLADGRSLTVGGTVSDPSSIALNVTGNLVLAGALSSRGTTVPGTVTLTPSGTLTQTAGTIDAGTLTGSASSVALTAAGNQITTLAGFTSNGGFSLVDAGSLSVTRTVSDPTAISLNVGGNLALSGSLTTGAGSTVSLTSAGTITQTAGAITAGTLTGSATGAALLGQSGNSIATLAGFTTVGDFTLTDSRSLVVSAPVDPNTVTLSVTGDLTLNSSVTANTVVLDVTGALSEGFGGSIVADTLTGQATSAVLNQSNQIGALGALTTTMGFALTNTGTLTIAGPVTDRQSITVANSGPIAVTGSVTAPAVSLAAGGAISETASGQISTDTLSLSVGSGTLSSTTNRIGALAGTITGDLSLSDSIGLGIASAGARIGGTLNLTVAGAVTGANLAAQALTGSATSVALTGSGNQIGALGPFASTGGFNLVDTTSLTVAGTVSDPTAISLNVAGNLTLSGSLSSPGTVTLTATGAITQPGGTVIAGTLTGGATSVALNATGNQIAALGPFTSTGGFSLVDSTPLTFSGAVSDPSSISLNVNGNLALPFPLSSAVVTLISTGTLTQPGGAITAGTLTGSASSAVLTNAGNRINTLGSFTSTSGFSLTDATALAVTGAVSDPSAIALNVASNLTLSGTLSSAGTVTLTSTRAIAESGGTITARTLTGSATSVALNSSNQITTLGAFSTTGGFSLANLPSLTVAGPVSDPTAISLNVGGNLALSGTLSSAGTVTLTSAGALTEPGGAVTAGTLTGSASSVALTGTGNKIAALGPFTSTGGFSLVDSTPLTFSGAVSDPTAISLNVTGNLALPFPLSSGTVTLISSGTLTQPGGAITATTLTGSASAVTLTNANNKITTLGAFTSTGGFSLVDATSLTVAGSVSDPTAISLNVTGNLALSRSLSSPSGTVTLVSSGALTQTGGTITAGTLTGSASSAALTSTGNQIAALGPFTSTGGFSLVDSTPLTFSGPVSDPTAISLNVTGNLALPFPLSSGTVTLISSGTLTQPGGAINATTLSGSASAVTLTNAGNQIATLGAFTSTSGFSLADARSLTVAGPVSDPSGMSLTVGGNLTLSGTLSSAGTLTLTAAGAITQPGGIITAGTLTGSATSVALTAAGNQIAALGGFTSTGGFSLVDARPLTFAGAVSDPTAVSLNVTGDLALPFALSSGTVTLIASGTLTQPGGAITAGTLTGSASSVVLTNTGNQITTLGAFTSKSGFSLADARSLTVAGPVSDPSGIALNANGTLTLSGPVSSTATVTLTAAGAITQPGGAITAGTLTGSASSVALTAAGNQITTLGSFTSTGGFSLVDGRPLVFAGTLSDPTAISLNVAGNLALSTPLSSALVTLISSGTLTQSGGPITAGTLSGSANSAVLTDANNQIASLGSFTSNGGFSLADATSLTVAGAVSDPSAIALNVRGDLALSGTLSSMGAVTLAATGSISQPGGTITAGVLTGNAIGSAGLGQIGNNVATLAGFTTGGDFTLADGRSLLVSAPVDPTTVTMRIIGDLTLNSRVTGGTVVLDVSGAIVEGPGGAIVADVLTGRGSTAVLNGGNQVGAIGGLATTSGLALSNAGALTVAGPVTDDQSIAIATSGPITLAGTVAAPTVALNATAITQVAGALTADTLGVTTPGALTQSGGTLSVGTLTGSADSIDVGRSGTAQIARIADLAATGRSPGTLTVVDAAPLRLSGTVSARYLSLTSTGSMVLADGAVIRTDGQPLSTQLNATGATPGSNLSVRPGTSGTASLTQAGTATITPITAPYSTLRIDLPSSGGTIGLGNLQAANADLVLNVGSGAATGSLVAHSLTVLGARGQASLTGSVGGLSGDAAAQRSALLPAFDLRYTLNGCAISVASCSGLDGVVVPGVFQPGAAAAAAISSVIRPDILALDVLDLSVTRDRDDPTLLLPNISDKDY